MSASQHDLGGRGFMSLDRRIRSLEEKIINPSLSLSTNSIWDKLEGVDNYLDKKSAAYYSKKDPPVLCVLRDHVVDFWNNISLPGFKYVGEPGRHRSDRYIWIVVLFASLLVSSKYIGDAYRKWQGSPVLLSFNDSLTPVAVIPFPAVTICPGRRLGSDHMLKETKGRCKRGACGQQRTNLLSAADLVCPKSTHFQSSEQRERYHSSEVGDAIEQAAIGCEEILEWFKFSKYDYVQVEGNRSQCSTSFQTLFIEGSSVCFTFNMLPANRMFRPGVIPPVVDHTSAPGKTGWTPDVMFDSSNADQTIPRYIDTNGRWSGLFVGISNFTSNASDLCNDTMPSKIFIHSPAELPVPQSHPAVDLPEHRELFVRVRPTVVAASDELSDYTPAKRRCYFTHERPLALFSHYTQSNCQLECRVNCSLSICDCVPFFMPRLDKSVKICGKEYRTSCSPFLISGILEGRFTLLDILKEFRNDTGDRVLELFGGEASKGAEGKNLTEEMVNGSYPACGCDCPAECTTLDYEIKVVEGPPLDPSLSDQFSRVAVFFAELEFSSVVRKELIGLTDFIANSGGVLGVFTGFSFLAICELVYYLTLRLWTTIKRALDPPEKRKEQLLCCFCCGPAVQCSPYIPNKLHNH